MNRTKRLAAEDSGMARKAILHVLGKDVPEDHLRRFLEIDSNYLLVAEDASGIVGLLLAYRLVRIRDAGSKVFLYEIEVIEGARRKGVGRSLVGAVVDLAKADGAVSVFGLTSSFYEGAAEFYRATGAKIVTENEILFEYACRE